MHKSQLFTVHFLSPGVVDFPLGAGIVDEKLMKRQYFMNLALLSQIMAETTENPSFNR
jgi:hypothetical protein